MNEFTDGLVRAQQWLNMHPDFLERFDNYFPRQVKGENFHSKLDRVFCGVMGLLKACHEFYSSNSGVSLRSLKASRLFKWYDTHLVEELNYLIMYHKFSGMYNDRVAFVKRKKVY